MLVRFRKAQVKPAVAANLEDSSGERRGDGDGHMNPAVRADMVAYERDAFFAACPGSIIVGEHPLGHGGT